jgi:hypothetical protein
MGHQPPAADLSGRYQDNTRVSSRVEERQPIRMVDWRRVRLTRHEGPSPVEPPGDRTKGTEDNLEWVSGLAGTKERKMTLNGSVALLILP